MEHEFSNDSSFSAEISQQFDNLFGGRGSELGIKVFAEFSQVFLTEIDSRVRDFSAALEAHDYQEFQRLAHKLRGSIRTLGAHSIADALQNIEDHCRKESQPNHQTLLQWRKQILDGIPRLVGDLREFTASLKSAS